MGWARAALEERAYKRVEITVGGVSGVAWMRRLSPVEHVKIWGAMARSLTSGPDGDGAREESDPREMQSRIEASAAIVQACFFEADEESGARTDTPLFDAEMVSLVDTSEFSALVRMVSEFSGISAEVQAVADHFPGEPE